MLVIHLFILFHSSWQKEEDQAAPAPVRSRQVEDHRPHSPVPWYHRLRGHQGSPPGQGLPPRRWYHRPQETPG